MNRKTPILLLACLLLLCARSAAKEDVPHAPTGWVNDYAGVIPDEFRQKLTGLIREVEQKTSAEIAVVAVESIAPYDENSYARMIFDTWKIGKKGKDNGVLILLAVKERRWRIEAGYGIEGILPDGLCGQIGRAAMVPYFKEGKYGEGLYSGTAALAALIAKDSGVTLDSLAGLKVSGPTDGNAPHDASGMFIFYLFLLIFFSVWNLPWPIYIGLPFTLFFAFALYLFSPVATVVVIVAYMISIIMRLNYWSKLPKHKRPSFIGFQTFGGTISSGGWSGGGGFGGGGFGGGGGGGGGAGGGF